MEPFTAQTSLETALYLDNVDKTLLIALPEVVRQYQKLLAISRNRKIQLRSTDRVWADESPLLGDNDNFDCRVRTSGFERIGRYAALHLHRFQLELFQIEWTPRRFRKEKEPELKGELEVLTRSLQGS